MVGVYIEDSFRSQILKGKRTWIVRDVYFSWNGYDRAALISALNARFLTDLTTDFTICRYRDLQCKLRNPKLEDLKVSIKRRTKLTQRCRSI